MEKNKACVIKFKKKGWENVSKEGETYNNFFFILIFFSSQETYFENACEIPGTKTGTATGFPAEMDKAGVF